MSTLNPLARFHDRLSLPLIAAPMFLVSGVELVVAACRNGVIGAFPTVNCRSPEQLDGWLVEIEGRLQRHSDEGGKLAAPICPNLIVHRSNARLEQDLQVLLRHRPEIVITSVGSPAPVLAALHDAGALVFADVASIRHAERAVKVGADGLVLLTAGAGGQTGWLNPFVFVRAVRAFFNGPIVLAGGIGGSRFLFGLRSLGHEITVVVNNGDDITLFGLRVCPDLDTVMYTLGGGISAERGWGREDETFRLKDELASYGAGPAWFGLGDLDLATHIARTMWLREGVGLDEVTRRLCERWQPGVRLLPATNSG